MIISMLKECEYVIPLKLPGLDHCILFGDRSHNSLCVGSRKNLFETCFHSEPNASSIPPLAIVVAACIGTRNQ